MQNVCKRTFSAGSRAASTAHPTFFINGVRHEGAWNFELLLAALKAVLAVNDDPICPKP